jgi:hypothetical protein
MSVQARDVHKRIAVYKQGWAARTRRLDSPQEGHLHHCHRLRRRRGLCCRRWTLRSPRTWNHKIRTAASTLGMLLVWRINVVCNRMGDPPCMCMVKLLKMCMCALLQKRCMHTRCVVRVWLSQGVACVSKPGCSRRRNKVVSRLQYRSPRQRLLANAVTRCQENPTS